MCVGGGGGAYGHACVYVCMLVSVRVLCVGVAERACVGGVGGWGGVTRACLRAFCVEGRVRVWRDGCGCGGEHSAKTTLLPCPALQLSMLQVRSVINRQPSHPASRFALTSCLTLCPHLLPLRIALTSCLHALPSSPDSTLCPALQLSMLQVRSVINRQPSPPASRFALTSCLTLCPHLLPHALPSPPASTHCPHLLHPHIAFIFCLYTLPCPAAVSAQGAQCDQPSAGCQHGQ